MAGEFVGILVLWLVFNTILAAVVSSHAKKNGYDGYFWLVFLFGVVGVLLYVADTSGSNESHSNEDPRESIRKSSPKTERTLAEEGAEVAVSAVYNHLEREGVAKSDYFIEQVYPVYPAGYDSGLLWWDDCIAPELRMLSSVEPPTDERETWVHRRTLERRRARESGHTDTSTDERAETPSDNWMTVPDSDFMHREFGERGRGLYVEVTDGAKEANFFVRDGRAKPESNAVTARNGEEWIANVTSYLENRYPTS